MNKINKIVLEDEEVIQYEKLLSDFEIAVEKGVKEEIEHRGKLRVLGGFLIGIFTVWIPILIGVLLNGS